MEKRSVKLQVMCGRCNTIHEEHGECILYAIIGKYDKKSDEALIDSGMLGINNPDEIRMMFEGLCFTVLSRYPLEFVKAIQGATEKRNFLDRVAEKQSKKKGKGE